MPLRIVQITKDWSPNGGVASYTRDLAGELCAGGHEVTVVHADPGAPPLGRGVREVLVAGFADYSPGSDQARAQVVLDALFPLMPDIVHVQGNDNFALEAGLRRVYATVKTLHTYDFCPTGGKFHFLSRSPCRHATSALCVPRMVYKRCLLSRRPSVIWSHYRRVVDANANNAAYGAVIVASAYVRQQALATGYPPQQVRVLPYFTIPPPMPPDPPERPGTILFCGRIVPEKGLVLLLRVLARLDVSWRLIVAGDGYASRSAKRLADRLGLADRVTFQGWADRQTLRALYAEASVVVVPSLWPEPFGIVGLEAMAYARPVVAFAVGGIPEWLDDGVTGFLVRPYNLDALADRLRACLESPALARALGERGRARVECEFTAARHLESLMRIYDDVRRRASIPGEHGRS
jgi:glycosyltransferase involved in cell wall biosynthesis